MSEAGLSRERKKRQAERLAELKKRRK